MFFDRARIAVNSMCGIGNSLTDGTAEVVGDLLTAAQGFVKSLLATACKAALSVIDVAEKVAEGAIATIMGSTAK
jgi:hypothetical protein